MPDHDAAVIGRIGELFVIDPAPAEVVQASLALPALAVLASMRAGKTANPLLRPECVLPEFWWLGPQPSAVERASGRPPRLRGPFAAAGLSWRCCLAGWTGLLVQTAGRAGAVKSANCQNRPKVQERQRDPRLKPENSWGPIQMDPSLGASLYSLNHRRRNEPHQRLPAREQNASVYSKTPSTLKSFT